MFLKYSVPNITGESDIGGFSDTNVSPTGVFRNTILKTNTGFQWVEAIGTNVETFGFNASLSNAIFGKSSTVQSPAFQILIIIKT